MQSSKIVELYTSIHTIIIFPRIFKGNANYLGVIYVWVSPTHGRAKQSIRVAHAIFSKLLVPLPVRAELILSASDPLRSRQPDEAFYVSGTPAKRDDIYTNLDVVEDGSETTAVGVGIGSSGGRGPVGGLGADLADARYSGSWRVQRLSA